MSAEDDEALEVSIELYRNSHFTEAITQLRILQKQFPQHARILRYLALSYAAAGEADLASKMHAAFLKATSSRGKKISRNLLLMDEDAFSAVEQRQQNSSLQMDRTSVISLAKAITHYRQKEAGAAIVRLEALLPDFPRHPRVLRFLALSYERQGRMTEAARIFALFLSEDKKRMKTNDRIVLLQAIEDIQMGDVRQAHGLLKELFEDYPQEPRLLRHLSLANEELGLIEDAASAYALWRRVEEEERLAWLGSARVLVKMQQIQAAADVLGTWVKAHPEDLESMRSHAKLLMKLNRDSEAEKAWWTLLNAVGVTPLMQAEAYYHLATLAFTEGNASQVRRFVDQCLTVDPEGMYAQMARDLREMNLVFYPEGFGGSAAAGVYYTSNVEMLPDTLQSQQADTSDVFSKVDMTLAWRLSQVMLGYTLNSKWYVERDDYNAMSQSGFVNYSSGQFSSELHLDYVLLGDVMLYAGGGLDFSWGSKGWIAAYGVLLKQYNTSYGFKGIDYSYLDSVNHGVQLSKRLRMKDFGMLSLSLTAETEQAAGYANGVDAASYQQFGAGAVWSYNHDALGVTLAASMYQRQYQEVDSSVLATVTREDIYQRYAADVAWKMSDKSKHALIGHVLWQRNDSNYVFPTVFATSQDKDFTEWETGLAWQYVW
ncbi:MAG: tetratricopeptide repeat protein [Mariprofundaceae bacterium]|nr:tetratricopeptide repeat protein [Mariprofundaceae bacterium]